MNKRALMVICVVLLIGVGFEFHHRMKNNQAKVVDVVNPIQTTSAATSVA